MSSTLTIHTDTPSAKVTYRGSAGEKFSVIFRQKPNPIGFGARLPGDAPAKPSSSTNTTKGV